MAVREVVQLRHWAVLNSLVVTVVLEFLVLAEESVAELVEVTEVLSLVQVVQVVLVLVVVVLVMQALPWVVVPGEAQWSVEGWGT
jgi:hypothetical protein